MSADEPSAGFLEAWQAFRKRYDWARPASRATPGNIEQARLTTADIEAFVTGWNSRLPHEEFRAPFEELRTVVRDLRRIARLAWCTDLLATVKARLQ